MDAKITKIRLSRMLSYDWLKIIGIAAAVIIVWILIFTMTATRITTAQSFVVYNYMGNISVSSTKFYDAYNKAFNNGVFSYEVLEAECYDLPMNAEYAYTVLDSHLAADEGDVVLVADIDDTSRAYVKDGKTLYDSYLQSFVGSYRYRLENLDPEAMGGYFDRMEKYLNSYYNGDYENGALNPAKVEADFRARIKANKDKRYKKESEIKAGIAKDIERIQAYRDALVEFYGYLEAGLIALDKTTIYDHANGDKVVFEGVMSINLCPNVETMGKLSEYVAYQVPYEDDAGETKYSKSAENMHIAFLRMETTEPGFEYESLLYVNDLVATYHTVAE